MLKELLKAAKIGVGEFAKLASVSRITGSLWVNDHAKPHPLHKDRIENVIKALEDAVLDKRLPFPNKLAKDVRLTKLKEIVAS